MTQEKALAALSTARKIILMAEPDAQVAGFLLDSLGTGRLEIRTSKYAFRRLAKTFGTVAEESREYFNGFHDLHFTVDGVQVKDVFQYNVTEKTDSCEV